MAPPAAPRRKASKKSSGRTSSNPIDLVEDEPRSVRIVVNGTPVPLQQRRLSRSNRYYTPSAQSLKKFRDEIRSQLPANIFRGAIEVAAVFFFKGPDANGKVAWTGTSNKIRKVTVTDLEYPSEKPFPDLDNLTKFINDGMKNGVLEDDVQVTDITVKKRYTKRDSRTVITITAKNHEVKCVSCL